MSVDEAAASVSSNATTLRLVSQLLKQLRVLHLNLVDAKDLITRLVSAHQWVYAEQVACAASEELSALRAATRVLPKFISDSENCCVTEEDGLLGLTSLQTAVRDACATRNERTTHALALAAQSQSVEKNAAFLGGYNRRTDACTSRQKSPVVFNSWRSHEVSFTQVDSSSSDDDADQQALLWFLLRLAQRRLNRKLVAKLSGILQSHCCAGATAIEHSSTSCHFDFDVPSEDQAADSYESADSKGDLTRLPPYSLPSGTTIECFDVSCDHLQSEAALQRLRAQATASDALPAIGVDAEWIAGRRVALLQLAAPGVCVLLRLHLLPKDATAASAAALLPPSLASLLGDASILKLGVGVDQDLRLLHSQFGVIARGVVDLQNLAACCGCSHAGLQRLTAEALGLHLCKRNQIRCSDWEAAALSPDQIQYAAIDAHVAVDIFSHFYGKYGRARGSGSSCSSSSSSSAAAAAVVAWCAPLTDRIDRKAARKLIGQPSSSTHLSRIFHSTTSVDSSDDVVDDLDPSQQSWAEWAELTQAAESAREDGPFDSRQLLARLARLGIVGPDAVLVSSLQDPPQELIAVESSDGAEQNHELPFEVKSLALFVNGMPLVAVLASGQKLDAVLLAQHLQLPAASRSAISRKLRLATPQECVTKFGYRPGTMPPLGHRNLATAVVVDAACIRQTHRPMLAGGGDFGVCSLVSVVLTQS
jgi:prolyl-tRNA editing enzyme YbaK/EbsC (Cys-tRNA(Pro) deacylase)